MAFIVAFENAGETVLIGQHPSFAVPAPGALAIFGLGLAGIGWMRRRKWVLGAALAAVDLLR